MRSLKNQLLVVFVFFLQSFFAQYFEFKWSDKIEYSNNKNGFFTGFINTSGKNIYVMNSNYAVSPLNKNDKLKLFAYDKLSMAEVGSVAVKGYPENLGSEAEYKELHYHKTVVMDDRVLVFWIKVTNTDTTKQEEVFVESFKTDLERDKSLKKVFTYIQPVRIMQSIYSPSAIVVVSNKEAGNIVVGSELTLPGQNVQFKYVVLSTQLSASHENQVTLPTRYQDEGNGLTSSYDFGKDGNLYIRSNVKLTREEQKKLKQNEGKSYLVLTVINPVTKKMIDLELKGESKTITDFSYLVTGAKTKVYGFFGDLTKDPSGIDKQGIFHVEIDSDTLVNQELKYSYFEKVTLNKLFPKTKGNRKKATDANPQSKDEELNTRFDIENIFLMEDGSAVLFFTRKYNYKEITSSSGLNGKNEYKTDYYCEKNNVSAIRITGEGKILWTSNLERSITYDGTDIADLRVIYKLNKFYVVYGTESAAELAAKNGKKPSDFNDNFDYATFDPVTGQSKKINLLVNEEDVVKKEKKLVNPQTILVYDGNFYMHNMIVKQKVGWYIANILCFPTIYYSVLSGNVKHSTGDLGVLILMEGKKPNKKKSGKK